MSNAFLHVFLPLPPPHTIVAHWYHLFLLLVLPTPRQDLCHCFYILAKRDLSRHLLMLKQHQQRDRLKKRKATAARQQRKNATRAWIHMSIRTDPLTKCVNIDFYHSALKTVDHYPVKRSKRLQVYQ